MLREICEALELLSSEKPLLLLLEDLHWSDRSTVDLISTLARRRTPCKLMVIGTYRPVDLALAEHPLKAVKQELFVHQLCSELVLEPLAEAEVAEFLLCESRGFEVPEGLSALIYRHSEGNPLFMVAALDHMCERGLIALEDGTWQIKAPLEKVDLDAPESLQQMIELRIERMTPEEQRALEVVSLLRKFPLSVAAGSAVSDVGPDAFEEVLEKIAKRHQVIRRAGFRTFHNSPAPSPCYEFVHELYRHVVYKRMGTTRKRRLHQRMGEVSEALLDTAEPEVITELAYQFEQGGDWPRAVKYLLSAADTAGWRFEPRQAA
jgi:predicted ATPase